jgi:cyclic lactone autoinducer peptide
MKNMTKLFAVALTVVATAMASSACFWFIYQPEEPACLREE